VDFYFSGVSGASEYGMLAAAGVRHLLVDQFDLPNVPCGPRARVALDSGAYRAMKKRLHLRVDDYIRLIRNSGPFDFVVSLDRVGDPASSRHNWEAMRRARVEALPVWQWGAEPDELRAYLDEAQIVGIGGIATLMRNKDARMLDELTAICESFPDRLHIFGMNWLRAIEQLKNKVFSADSSKWLDGARYSHVIFINTRTGHLSQAPAKALGLTLDRSERCISSARNLEEFVNLPFAQQNAA
jgi:hypothetical protein